MYLNHTQAFGAFDLGNTPEIPATTQGLDVRPSGFCSDTLLETEFGWRPVHALQAGDRVQTLDGGLVRIKSVRARETEGETLWHIPALALSNCSDMWLTGAQHVALAGAQCERLHGAPHVLAPITAMAGYCGIRPDLRTGRKVVELTCEAEEIVYAHTGAMLHIAAPSQEPFFPRLSYGETRAMLTLLKGSHIQPDPIRFAA